MSDYHVDKVYLKSLQNILENGVKRSDRTGVGTISIFGSQERYDLTKGFPLLTTKKVYTRGVTGELLFFLTGKTNNNWLKERRITIWDEWAKEDGDLGPIYGFQWNHFGADYVKLKDRDNDHNPGGINQISRLLKDLKTNPFSRRHIVSAWNPTQIDDMALPPCHTMFQFYVTPDSDGNPWGLSCQLYQRSADQFLGVPFNIASYSILTQLIAEIVDLVPLEFVHTFGDSHIYTNHLDQVKEQLSRLDDLREMPTLKINHPIPINELDLEDPELFERYSVEDFEFVGYDPHPVIKAPIAV